MTIEACYDRMGGDYEDVLHRLGNADRVRRFLLKIPQDESFALLSAAMDSRDAKEAFRAAHSMKGISANLGLTRLYQCSSDLSDVLRDGAWRENCLALFERMSEAYANTIACIRALDME